jgi:TRAP-type mannitol/chloroaromatic compound transport system permease small subunit
MSWRLAVVALQAFLAGEVSGESNWNPVIWPLRGVVAIGFALFALQILAEIAKSARVVFGRPGV